MAHRPILLALVMVSTFAITQASSPDAPNTEAVTAAEQAADRTTPAWNAPLMADADVLRVNYKKTTPKPATRAAHPGAINKLVHKRPAVSLTASIELGSR